MKQQFSDRLRLLPFLLAIGIAVCAAGCAGFGKRLEPPEIMLANITGGRSEGLETVFVTDLRIFNTNDVPLEVRSADCELEINGSTFARGISAMDLTIPAYGTEIVPVEVYTSLLNILFSAAVMAEKAGSPDGIRKLTYRLSGRLRLKEGTVFPSVIPFETSGELALDKLLGPVKSTSP